MKNQNLRKVGKFEVVEKYTHVVLVDGDEGIVQTPSTQRSLVSYLVPGGKQVDWINNRDMRVPTEA